MSQPVLGMHLYVMSASGTAMFNAVYERRFCEVCCYTCPVVSHTFSVVIPYFTYVEC
jgi:hypothetical protein